MMNRFARGVAFAGVLGALLGGAILPIADQNRFMKGTLPFLTSEDAYNFNFNQGVNRMHESMHDLPRRSA